MSSHENEALSNKVERQLEGQHPYFDLNQLAPLQVADLLAVFGDAVSESGELSIVKGEAVPAHVERMANLLDPLSGDITDFADRNPERAYTLSMTLANSEHRWPRSIAAEGLCRLLRHVPAGSEERQEVLDRLRGLLGDADDHVKEYAEEAVGALVETNDLDEPTTRMINAWLPDYMQRQREWPHEWPAGQ